jgi:hypothetical protein
MLSRLGSGKLDSGAMLCRMSKLERLLIDFEGDDEVESLLDDNDVCP